MTLPATPDFLEGLSDELSARFHAVDEVKTYTTMIEQSGAITSDKVEAALESLVSESKLDQGELDRDDLPVWRSSLNLRKSTSEKMHFQGISSVFWIASSGDMGGQLILSHGMDPALGSVDVFIQGRFVLEVQIPAEKKPGKPGELSVVELSDELLESGFRPEQSAENAPIFVELVSGNRVIFVTEAERIAGDTKTIGDEELAGAFVDIRKDEILFWAVDRNFPARSIWVNVTVDGRNQQVIAFERARFTKQNLREGRTPVGDLIQEGMDSEVSLTIALNSQANMRRGNFMVRRAWNEYLIWNAYRNGRDGIFVTAFIAGNSQRNPVMVSLHKEDLSLLVPGKFANQSDKGGFAFKNKQNSVHFSARELSSNQLAVLGFEFEDGEKIFTRSLDISGLRLLGK